MFKKNSAPKSKIEKRVEKIATSDLTSWAEQTLFVLGRNIGLWQRNGDQTYLQEAETSAEALLAIVREMKQRTHS